jgi:5-methylcytosine-specific restriction endonuclease McrA
MSNRTWRIVIERDGLLCCYCLHPVIPERFTPEGPDGYKRLPAGRRWAHLDHVIPWSKGGSDSPDNLVIACAPCNMRKKANYWTTLSPGA